MPLAGFQEGRKAAFSCLSPRRVAHATYFYFGQIFVVPASVWKQQYRVDYFIVYSF